MRAQVFRERVVPDGASLFPCAPANLHRRQIERVVGNPRVDVHAAVVVAGLDEVLHVGRLRIFAQDRIVVRSARRFHRS